jgi:hypothetical protein
MSLHVAAKHLASKGRDGDTELVHMTKGEIQGLQGLALAAGGSLSINPDTGLVEASFLKRILPMVAGAGLMMIPGVGPLAAAGMVGGFETLRTGDVGKGLMAGLGAYGGAGLAQGLSTAGSSGVMEAAQQNAINAGQAVGTEAATAVNPSVYTGDLAGFTPAQQATIQAQRSAVMATPGIDTAGQATFGNVGRGIGSLGTETGRSLVYQGMPTGTLPALGATAVSAMTPDAPKPPGMPEEDERYKGSPYRYNLASGFQGSTPTRPSPYYRPLA